MTSTTFFIIFIPILAVLLLGINLLLAPHNPYQEKDSAFECGFHSFLGQNRTQFSVSFFIFALLFLLFDLEILLIYPYSVSSYTNDIYGLVIMMIFFVLLTLGFIFELGKNALTIDSRQTSSYSNGDISTPHLFTKWSFMSMIKHWFSDLGFNPGNKEPVTNGDADNMVDGEPVFYVLIVKKDESILVPVKSVDRVDFEAVLSKPIYKCVPIANNEEDSLLAVKKATSMFVESELCICDLKTLSGS